MDIKDKRFIEDTFPIREVSDQGANEKNIRTGHISTMHIWWARRPLATSRATNLAALISVPDNEEEKQKIRNFISELAKWENSNNEDLLNKARKMILDANNNIPPRILDPFGGGGSIPLEALRLGCVTYSSDYNPVATLIQKCTLEFPQKFGKPVSLEQYKSERNWYKEDVNDKNKIVELSNDYALYEPETTYLKNTDVNPLIEDVKYWSSWVINEFRKEIDKYYPDDKDGSNTVGYIWAHSIPCQNPTCSAEIPLMKSFWLSKKDKRKVFVRPINNNKKIGFKIISGDESDLSDSTFSPDSGTVSRAVVNCPICGSIMDEHTTRKLFIKGKSSQRMIVVIKNSDILLEIRGDIGKIVKELQNNKVPDEIFIALKERGFEVKREYFKVLCLTSNTYSLIYNSDSFFIEFKISIKKQNVTINPQGKSYRLADEKDLKIFDETSKYLEQKRAHLTNEWGIDPVPDEEIKRVPFSYGVINVWVYGILKWGGLFNSRQLLSNIILCEIVRNLNEQLEYFNEEYCTVIKSYLALNIDRVINRCSQQNVWNISAEKAEQVFMRNNIQMQWDYCELSPIGTQGWENQIYYLLKSLEGLKFVDNYPILSQGSATNMRFEDNYFDAVFTDPPYYDNIPYSYLSDFFYVWLKRTLANDFPELFSTILTPKNDEIVAYENDPNVVNFGKDYFESLMKKALLEINRVLKPNGILVLVYAHKSTKGWETLINSLLSSGLVISASYPLSTEMAGRMRATDSAALASSIYLIARKVVSQGIGFYNEVKVELKSYLNMKLDQLWAEGIIGADFFVAAIGSAIEVFGKYEKVIDYEGNIKRADVLLDDVREIVMNYTIGHILHNGFSGEVSELTKFYVIYRFSYGEAKLEFDEANKLARSVGIDLTQEFNKGGFIKKDKEFVRVLNASNRKIEDLKEKNELVDVLHHSILLWERGEKSNMMQLLAETGFGKSEAFFRVAQAISESLAKTSPESKEKNLLDGFLGSKERIKSDISSTEITKRNIQGKLAF